MIKKSRNSTPGSKWRMTDLNNECCSLSIRLIFAQIHRSSNRWQLQAIAAPFQHLYHLSRNLVPDEVRAFGIRPCRPRPLVAQRTDIHYIFHPLSYFTSPFWLFLLYRFSAFRSTFLFKSILLFASHETCTECIRRIGLCRLPPHSFSRGQLVRRHSCASRNPGRAV